MRRKLILFGAGERGAKFLCMNFPHEVELIFDNYRCGKFYGIKIEKPRYISDIFIVVTCIHYPEIRNQLISLGYREFEDFIPEQIYEKKMAVAYGNCHAEIVRQYLVRNKDFSKEYGFYPFPMIQSMKDDFDYEYILPRCSLFIDQAIRDTNRYGKKYASSALSDCLSKTCVRVCIPNLYGLPQCFFPQLGGGGTAFLPSGEANIKKWYMEGWTKEQMVDKLLEGGIYSEEYILSLWEKFCEKLLIREREWDIKISDYIFEHYKTEKLFTNPNHITSELAREIAIRTLKYLGYKAEFPYVIPAMDDLEVFIYKDVKKALGLEYEERYIRNYARYLLMEESDVDIEEYVNQCYQSCAFFLSAEDEKWI